MKKQISLLLTLCMLLPLLIGCPGGQTPGSGGGGGDDGDGETQTPYLDSLGDRDYGGDNILIYAMSLYEY